MRKITKQITSEIGKYCEQNQPKIDWYNCDFDRDTIKNILEKGLDVFTEEMHEMNLDYIFELEDAAVKNVQENFNEYDPDSVKAIAKEHICVDINIENLLKRLPDILCLVYAYSNYDCCNSFDRYEKESYLYDVYQRIKKAVKLKDYMWEFHNGAYGGSLFCFAFKTDIKTYLEIKEKEKNKEIKKIFIPKDTQFGFFSSLHGAGSVFEKTTHKNAWLTFDGETEYDCLGFTADCTQSYSLHQTYGGTDFINKQIIQLIYR